MRFINLMVVVGVVFYASTSFASGHTRTNSQTGIASYYGGRHNGRPTASGDIFDSSKMTAAHMSLPFGTRVKVTNLENGNSVVVKITDRGPAKWTGRIIDVTTSTARKLGMIKNGIVRVSVQIVQK